MAVAVSACTMPAVAPPASALPAQQATTPVAPGVDLALQAARGFAAAELEWQSAIAIGRALTARGLIKGQTAITVRRWNAEARAVIVRGKAAVDAAEQVRLTASLLGLVGKLDAITGRK
jgi:hypothetical protein